AGLASAGNLVDPGAEASCAVGQSTTDGDSTDPSCVRGEVDALSVTVDAEGRYQGWAQGTFAGVATGWRCRGGGASQAWSAPDTHLLRLEPDDRGWREWLNTDTGAEAGGRPLVALDAGSPFGSTLMSASSNPGLGSTGLADGPL